MVLTAGNVASTLASFVRNLVVARLVSVEDFGIASALAMSTALLEMLSNLAVDRILVQAREGGTQRMQETAHAFQAVRGLVAGLMLFLAAGLIARLFGIPDVAWAFQVTALAPVLRGFNHLDVVRFQRDIRFLPSVLIDLVPQLLTLGLAWPLCLWLGDFRAMLWIIVLYAAAQLAVSHATAQRRYAWAWEREIISQMFAFGWPLMINGLLMFLILQGDKAVVGTFFSVRELGWYGAAFMLTLAPSMLATKVLQSLLLPLLAHTQNDLSLFQQRYRLTLEVSIAAGALIAVGLVIAGPGLLLLVFGERYAEGVAVVPWLALMQGVRTMKIGPMTAAVALGRTKIPMHANAARALALGAAVIAVWMGMGVTSVAIAGLCGELVSLAVSIRLVRGGMQLPLTRMTRVFVMVAFSLAIACVLSITQAGELSPWMQVGGGAAAVLITVALLFPVMPLAARRATALISGRGFREG